MEDLIKREDAIKVIEETAFIRRPILPHYLIAKIKGIPSAEPKQGKWIMSDIQCKEDTDNGNYQYICSVCGHGDIHARTQEVPYCWWCGARMKGADNDAD